MKTLKTLVLATLAILAILLFAACNGGNDNNREQQESDNQQHENNEQLQGANISIAVPRGPAALGMLHLMELAQGGTSINDYDFTIVGSPDEIPPLLIRGDVSVAAVPPNMASILYNNPDLDIVALSVPTLGVLHILDSTGEINSVEDLRGREIYASGAGGTPEFILNYILEGNGLTPGVDVDVVFRPEHAEIAALLESGVAEIAMLPEPFATTVQRGNENLEYALDLTEEWGKVTDGGGLVMTVVIALREFAEENREAIETFLSEHEASINFAEQNLDEAAELAAAFEIIPAVPVARDAIPRSNLTFIRGEQARLYLARVLEVFYEYMPQSIGGNLPDDDFFFGG